MRSPPQPTTPSLPSAIQSLYATFTPYHLHHPVTGCPCCTSAADDHRIRSLPLRDLTPAHLEGYARKALTALGTEDDFKHFLPRLLDLAATHGNIGHTEFEILIGKLPLAEWHTWPAPERTAVADYLTALWSHTLSTYPAPLDIDSYLCGLAQATPDLSPFLHAWQHHPSPATAAQHLADLLANNYSTLAKKRSLRNAFWEDHHPQMHQVIDWLLTPAPATLLEQAFFLDPSAPFAPTLSSALDGHTSLTSLHP